MQAGYATRTMSRDEVALAIEWAAQEGWNPGLHDAETFPAADPQGFFVGTLQGEPVASISVVKYEPGFAFLGLYIVRPEWRGRGLGRAGGRPCPRAFFHRVRLRQGVLPRRAHGLPARLAREGIAECLFLALCSRAGAAESVYLDLPEVNAAAVALAQRHHMRMVFETARMYTGRPPAVNMHGLYGVTTFELG